MWGVGINGCPEYVRQRSTRPASASTSNAIDLYYQHLVDPDTPVKETSGALGEPVAA